MGAAAWGLAASLVGGAIGQLDLASETATTANPSGVGLESVIAGKDLSGTPSPPPDSWSPDPRLVDGERPRPSYGLRPDPPPDAGDVLIWVPRLALLPAHLVLRYGVRVPSVAFISFLEENRVLERVNAALTFRDGKSGFAPTFLADFGLRPSVGFTTYHRDLVREGDLLQVSASFWVEDWVAVSAEAETPVLAEGSGAIGVFGSFVTRPDQPYFGEGPDTQQSDRANFRRTQVEGGLRTRLDLGGLHRFELEGAVRGVQITDGEPVGLLTRIDPDTGSLPPPQGFSLPEERARWLLLLTQARLRIDTRPELTPEVLTDPGTGVLLSPWITLGASPDEDLSLVRGGGEVAGFWDMTGFGHVLAALARVELAQSLGDVPIPFAELPSLGGLQHMRAFLPGRFLGDSTTLLTFSYRYPVWYLLEAELFASFGNAWGPGFGGFDVARQYFSGGLALRTSFERMTRLELILGLGTDRLDRGVEIDSVRVAVGLVEGF